MKYLLGFIILFLSFISFSQEMKVYQSFMVNERIAPKYDTNENEMNLSELEKSKLNQSVLNHLKNGDTIHEGYNFFYDDFVNENYYNKYLQFYVKPLTLDSNVFVNDSVLFSYPVLKLNDDKEPILDEEGYEEFKLQHFYKSFNNSLFKINSQEKWEYKNEKITKKNLSRGFVLSSRYHENDNFQQSHYFSNSKNSTDYSIFKKDIVYTHYFYPDYYRVFLNNDSIWDLPYANRIESGFKADAENNEYEVIKFLEPLFKDIHLNKLKLFEIDGYDNISSTEVKAENLDGLFQIFNRIKLSESGEPMLDEEGYETYITSKTHILPEDILGIEFQEDWYLAETTFQIKKKVKGIVLISAIYDEEGNLSGMKKIPAFISFE